MAEGAPATIKVGDKEYTAEQIVELEKGSLRMSDYTKGTQENAKERESLKKQAESVGNLIKLSEALADDPEGTAEQMKALGKELQAKKNAPGTTPAQKTKIEEELHELKAQIQFKDALESIRNSDPVFAANEEAILEFITKRHENDDKKIDFEAEVALWTRKNPDKVKGTSDFPIISHRRMGGTPMEKPVIKDGESYTDFYKNRWLPYREQTKT